MDIIHQKYCKYFSVLDPILGERPNVFAAWRNKNCSSDEYSDDDNESSDEDSTDKDDDEDDFICLSGDSEDENKASDKSTSIPELDVSDITTASTLICTTTSKKSSNESSNLDSSHSSSSNAVPSPKKRSKSGSTSDEKSASSRKSNGMSLMEASKKRTAKKRNISGKKGKGGKGGKDDSTEEDPMMKILQSQEKRMEMERRIHRDNMKLQNNQLNLESIKTQRETDMVALQVEKLRGDIIADITKHNFDVLQKRMQMKSDHPQLTDEYLDQILPFRKIP